MSAQDISAIPTANTLAVAEFKEPYRKMIKLLPKIVKLANNQNPNVTDVMKQQRMDEIKAVFDSYLDNMRVALGAVQETNKVFTDYPDSGPVNGS